MIFKARYVVPVDGPVIENGAVVVDDGRIMAVGPARGFSHSPVTDYGDAVICPGFVNAHTHLELSLLAGRIPPGPDFIDWLRRLVAASGAQAASRDTVQEAVQAGVAQSLRCGVTTLGDVTRTPQWTREVLAGATSQCSPWVRGVSFGEVIAIGNRRHLLDERLEAAASPVPSARQPDCVRVGISPHAPYTVEPDAMRACARRARADRIPLCIHLAETADEELFTRSCAGPFVDYLRGLRVWDDHVTAAGCGPVELALRTGLLEKRTIIAHANYVTDQDIAQIARSGASIAYCPRTHQAFEHPPHRFREMLAAGINVCIGTDSLASSPTLSILDELRFLRREHPDLTGQQIISMGTIRGARALGFEDVAGSLAPGKSADLVVIPLAHPASDAAWESILETTGPPTAVQRRGLVD